jgi:spore germination protein GerM
VKRLAAVLALVVVGCARGPQVTVIPNEDLPEIYSVRGQPTTQQTDRRAVIYFVRRFDESSFLLQPVVRAGPSNTSAAEFAMARLLAGRLEPGPEQDLQLGTAIPSETVLLGLEIADGVAEVNLSSHFESPEDKITHLLRIAQVVWTLTELPDVDAVRFLIHGVHQPVITQDGKVHLQVGRARYARFTPVDEEPVASPVGRLAP